MSDSPSGRRPGRLVALVLLVLLGGGAVLAAVALGDAVTLEALAARRDELRGFVARHAVLSALAFVLVYTLVTVAMLPGAAVVTVAGGFLFGAAVGTVCVVLGATAGATALFLLARTALGDALRRRAGGGYARLEAGFRENAFSYLLFLRLVPLFPFFLVNIAASLTGVRLATYVAATAIGIVPAVVAFTSLGAGLDAALAAGGSPSLADAISPQLLVGLGGLGLLALLPVAWRRFAARRGAR